MGFIDRIRIRALRSSLRIAKERLTLALDRKDDAAAARHSASINDYVARLARLEAL